MEKVEYIIVGDTERYDECLIYTGFKTRESAEQVVQRMLNDPTENDKSIAKGHTNLRVKEVKLEDCWWYSYTD